MSRGRIRFAEPSRKLSLAIAGTLAASQPPAALAAAALEEIIVTARKREENLQEIPESIQALPAAEISRAGLQSSRTIHGSSRACRIRPRRPGPTS